RLLGRDGAVVAAARRVGGLRGRRLGRAGRLPRGVAGRGRAGRPVADELRRRLRPVLGRRRQPLVARAGARLMGAARAMSFDHGPAGQLPLPPPLPPAAAQLLDQAHRSLAEAAACTDDPRRRYATAHLGALRGAAAVLAARTRPESGRRRPRSAWVLLGSVAPELGEWATFFAAGAAKRAAA